MPDSYKDRTQDRLGVGRCAATGAAVLFILCWFGAYLTPSFGTHMFVALFTEAPVDSSSALIVGVCASLIFGAVIGALTGLFYNLFRPRRIS